MSASEQGSSVIRVGIIGYGFMGKTHAMAYQNAAADGFPCRVVAIADPALSSTGNAGKSAGNISSSDQEFDTSSVEVLGNAVELLARADIDLVSICTHTDTHVELALQSMLAGKHVLVEKPIAINSNDVKELAKAANSSGRVCMPAMCMRFWPAWIRMREVIASREFGEVRSAVFHRLGSRPNWSTEFYMNENRSGGVLYDLHIHDTDFIVQCFGLPDSVITTGDGLHLSTAFHFEGGPVHVLAHAAWDHQPAAGFEMRCSIVCDQATIDFDINRADQLVVHQGADSKAVDVGHHTGYDGEVRGIINMILGKTPQLGCSMDDAVEVARLLDAQLESMRSGARVSVKD